MNLILTLSDLRKLARYDGLTEEARYSFANIYMGIVEGMEEYLTGHDCAYMDKIEIIVESN